MVSESAQQIKKSDLKKVLILVLVEDGLRAPKALIAQVLTNGLNPCSCGGWSQSQEWLLKWIN